jgi:hypothetical protein
MWAASRAGRLEKPARLSRFKHDSTPQNYPAARRSKQ